MYTCGIHSELTAGHKVRTMNDPTSPGEHQKKGLVFDPTINAGHMLTFGSMLVALFVAMNVVDKRLTVLEEARVYQREKDQSQDAQQLKAEEVMNRNLEKINNKLDDVIEFVRPMKR